MSEKKPTGRRILTQEKKAVSAPAPAAPAEDPVQQEASRDTARTEVMAAQHSSPAVPAEQVTWHSQYEAAAGLSHRNANPPLPCQDAALSRTLPRPTLIVADGAGSAAMSEVGSHTMVTGIARLLHTLDKEVAGLLDITEEAETGAARNFALLLVKHAKGMLDDLAAQHRRPQKDFRCTLLLAVAGTAHVLWLKIGDGALVSEHRLEGAGDGLQSEMRTLGTAGKGEFANLTQFIDDHLQPDDVQNGLLPAHDVIGLAAMSDGSAEKLIANDGSRVAPLLGRWLQALRQDKLPRRTLTRGFYDEAFCRGTSGDDCSLALLAAEMKSAG